MVIVGGCDRPCLRGLTFMNAEHLKPPALAVFILSWLLQDDWDTPLGDFEEYYNELAYE